MTQAETNSLNRIKRFFLICSGCDLEILSRAECRIEINKYIGIGATIFSTALLATFSGGYALYTVFQSVPLSIAFGLVWGSIIFNLDRYIVSTIRKSTPASDLTVREKIQWRLREFGRFAPRLLLAIFISIVITRPIELRLFKTEIDKEILNKTSNDLAALKGKTAREFPDIERLTKENVSLHIEIANKQKQVNALYELMIAKGMGEQRGNTTGRTGRGPFFRERTVSYESADAELTELKKVTQSKIEDNENTISELRRQQTHREGERVPTIERNGLIAQLTILSELSAANKSVELASWFLIFLFILLETAPIIVKILSERGPYDDIYEGMEHSVWAQEQKKIFEIDNDLETDLALVERLRAEILAAKVQLSRNTMEKLETLASAQLVDAQMRVSESLVKEWEKAQLDKLRSNVVYRGFSQDGNAPEQGPTNRHRVGATI